MAELRTDTPAPDDDRSIESPSELSDVTADTPVDETVDDADEVRAGKKSGHGFWTEVPALVIIALVLAMLLKTFVVQAFFIPSSSMEPTLLIGDRVLVTKTAYLYREPVRGEVVVFTETAQPGAAQPRGNVVTEGVRSLASGLGLVQGNERDFIKRIIGLPGETLELRDGVVLIDGQPLPEAAAADGGYLARPDLNDFGPVTVMPEHYFMLGDNRPNSADSRFGLGQIHRDQILGRAFVTIWPPATAGSLPIAEY